MMRIPVPATDMTPGGAFKINDLLQRYLAFTDAFLLSQEMLFTDEHSSSSRMTIKREVAKNLRLKCTNKQKINRALTCSIFLNPSVHHHCDNKPRRRIEHILLLVLVINSSCQQ